MNSYLEKFSDKYYFAVAAGLLTGVIASIFIQAYLVYLPNMSWTVMEYLSTGGILPYLGLFWVAPIATFGIPAFIYFRESYIAPSIVCLLVTALWTYGELTPGGDSSAAVIMLAFTPIYIALYAVAAGIEYGIRQYLDHDA